MNPRRLINLVIVGLFVVLGFTSSAMPVSAQAFIGKVNNLPLPFGVVVNPQTNIIYVTQFGYGVHVINGTNNSIIANIPISSSGAEGIAVNPQTNLIYVPDGFSTTWIIDGTNNSIVGGITVGTAPNAVAVNPSTNRIYVTNRGDDSSVSVIDGATNSVIASIPVAHYPRGVAVDSTTNRIYVANIDSSSVTVIDGNSNVVITTISISGTPFSIAVNSSTNLIYVTNLAAGSVDVIDGATNSIVTSIPIVATAQQLTLGLNPTINRLYVTSGAVNTVTFIDTVNNSILAILPGGQGTGGGGANSVGVNPITNRTYVANFQDASISIFQDFNSNYQNSEPVINSLSNISFNEGQTYSTIGSFTDVDSSSWTATVDYGDGSGTQSLSLSGQSFTLNHTYGIGGIFTITITVTDNQGATGTKTTTVTVNAPPQINALSGGSINQGGIYSENGSFTDSDSTSWTATVDYGGGSGLQPLTLNGKNFSLSHTYGLAGTFTVAVIVTDNQGAMGVATTTVVVNMPPTINTLSNATLNEGGAYSANGSFTDPDSTSWTTTVDYGDGSGVQLLPLSGMNFSLNHLYKDNGTYTVTVSVTDNQGATGTGGATVTVNNVAPTVGTITAPTSPTQVNTAITASAPVTDPGVLDTHTASWDWGDGTTSTGTITESNGSGSVTGTHTYTAAGVYTITLTVTDKDGGVGSSIFQYVVVYDPSAGYVTGAGTITSPIGAYVQDPSLSGKAIFGFVSKYQNGANLPTGSTQFRFVVANFSFKSTSYDWLVVGGARAQYKGSGTINGSGDYGFILTTIDGQVNGGGGIDKFRIKITDKTTGNVIYDNQLGAADTSDPTTAIDSGSIAIHN